MGAKPPPFNLFFEVLFLESYGGLGLKEKKAIERAVLLLVENPRHPSSSKKPLSQACETMKTLPQKTIKALNKEARQWDMEIAEEKPEQTARLLEEAEPFVAHRPPGSRFPCAWIPGTFPWPSGSPAAKGFPSPN